MSQHNNCRLCGGESFERKGSIRTTKKIAANKILECLNCSFVFLNDDSHISEFHYEQSLMHESHLSLEESRDNTAEDDLRRFIMLETEIKDRDLLEAGSGNGGFLKLAQDSANTAQGIEPEKKHHENNRIISNQFRTLGPHLGWSFRTSNHPHQYPFGSRLAG